jgi:hypothetical protein
MHRRSAAPVARLLPPLLALVSLVALACATEVEKKMQAMAGSYVHEMTGGPNDPAGVFTARREITLREGGRFVMTSMLNIPGQVDASNVDSGSYRVQGVTVSLHSEVERGMPMKFTLSGDTLFSANAAMAKAVAGVEIAEEAYVRAR